jgi:hypothetical protein
VNKGKDANNKALNQSENIRATLVSMFLDFHYGDEFEGIKDGTKVANAYVSRLFKKFPFIKEAA